MRSDGNGDSWVDWDGSNSSVVSDSGSGSELSMTWTRGGVEFSLLLSAEGVPEVLGKRLGISVLSMSSAGLVGAVGFSGAAEKGGALLGTGGVANPYTELAMPGRNRGSVKTLDT